MNDTLAIIKKADMTDMSFLVKNIDTIQDNWNKNQIFRTETEMLVSVLDDINFPTKAAKYWQAVREQSAMYTELVNESFEYRRKQVELDALMDSPQTPIIKIDVEELEFAMMSMRRTAEDRLREIKLWQAIMEEMDDGSFNTEDVNVHQLKSYNAMFVKQAEVLGANGSPSENANLVGQLRTTNRFITENLSCTAISDRTNTEAINKLE